MLTTTELNDRAHATADQQEKNRIEDRRICQDLDIPLDHPLVQKSIESGRGLQRTLSDQGSSINTFEGLQRDARLRKPVVSSKDEKAMLKLRLEADEAARIADEAEQRARSKHLAWN